MPVWLKLAGTHASVEWQVPHSAVVGMWFVPLAVALTPLWHELHVPDTWPWSTRVAGVHAFVAWQLSQLVSVVMCDVLLPVALTPLWQL
jgi:hypothetical protein